MLGKTIVDGDGDQAVGYRGGEAASDVVVVGVAAAAVVKTDYLLDNTIVVGIVVVVVMLIRVDDCGYTSILEVFFSNAMFCTDFYVFP